MKPTDSDSTPRHNDEALRWQLRALRREQMPARDLWPGIAASLATPAPCPASLRPAIRPVRLARRWPVPLALAATLAVAVGALGWWQRGPSPLSEPSPTIVQREAEGMTRQYRTALAQLAAAAPAAEHSALQTAFDELDRNAGLILEALTHDPDSRLLLQQLRRTYTHRLALARRVAFS